MDSTNDSIAITEGEKVLNYHFSSIGIDDVFLNHPPHPLLSTYLREGCKEPFTSWEITGTIKSTPEDFCVREIFSKNRQIPGVAYQPRVADLIPYDKLPRQNLEKNDNSSNDSAVDATPCATSDENIKPDKEDSEAKIIKGDSTPADVIRRYMGRALYSQDEKEKPDGEQILTSLRSLEKEAKERIDLLMSGLQNPNQTDSAVLIPPTFNTKSEDPKVKNEQREERGALHRALKIEFPYLKSENEVRSGNNPNERKHWIKVSVNDTYDDLVKYLYNPQDDLKALMVFQNRGFEGVKAVATRQMPKKSRNRKFQKQRHLDGRSGHDAWDSNKVTLRLRPQVSKDERRSIHHLIASKCKQFATSTISDYPLQKSHGFKDEEGSSSPVTSGGDHTEAKTTVAVIVSWQKQLLERGSRKRKRMTHNDEPNKSTERRYPNVLFVMKKRQKEHLSALQKLAQAVRCRQSDIGIAGIKDLQAITYQFCTIRNTTSRRVQKANKQLQLHGAIELSNFYQVDFVLNNGDLEGNEFEVTLRKLKRIHVEPKLGASAKESLITCDKDHLSHMIKRIQRHGFINFFGDQRVGAPGSKEEIGVRGSDIGRAMLQQDFALAIELLMTGRSICRGNTRESDKVLKVRQMWKETGGDPELTLKAFQGSDMMPRERAILKGLNRYGKDQPLEALRCLSYSMRVFWINAYQSLIWNKIASRRFRKFGADVVEGDLYLENNGSDKVKVVNSANISAISIYQVVLPLPGHNIRYPENEIGDFYRDLLLQDNITFEKSAQAEATAKGSYRRAVVLPESLHFEMIESDEDAAKLIFQLPKGSYATMLLRELMLTTATRPGD